MNEKQCEFDAIEITKQKKLTRAFFKKQKVLLDECFEKINARS